MKTTPTASAALLALLGLAASGCATGGASRADVRTSIQIQYGRVDEVEQVQLESKVGQSALLGGIVGALASRRHHLAGAVVGAAAGGAITAVSEGASTAFGYTVRMESGQIVKVVVDHGDIGVGQCVAVEQGRTTNVRLVSPSHCRPDARAAHAAPEVQAEAQEDAGACHAAKEAALAATTTEQFDLLEKKARLVCGH